MVKARKSVLQWGGGGGEIHPFTYVCCGGGGEICFRQIAHNSYSRHRIPSYTFIIYFPATLSYKDILFFQISQPARICLKNKYLRNTSIGCPCKKWIRAASNFIALYTISVNSWNVGKFFRSLILKDCIKVRCSRSITNKIYYVWFFSCLLWFLYLVYD